jgi:hypothetical protein
MIYQRGRKRSWPNVKHHSGICLEVPKKTRNLSQDIRPPGQDLKPGPPVYDSGPLTIRPQLSLSLLLYYLLVINRLCDYVVESLSFEVISNNNVYKCKVYQYLCPSVYFGIL